MDKTKQAQEILKKMAALVNPAAKAGMARYGISTQNRLGLSMPTIRSWAKELGQNHALALALWKSGIDDARILASLVDEPDKVTEAQLEAWVSDFNSWDVCDQTCSNLFSQTRFAYVKAHAWSAREEEFVKRAAFALIAYLAVHDKRADDKIFEACFSLIVRAASDERNFVKKAVNWALRQIGKRSVLLNKRAIAVAKKIKTLDTKSARWIATDAMRELESEAVQTKLKKKSIQKKQKPIILK